VARLALIAALAALGASRPASQIAPGMFFLPGVFVPGTQPDGNTVILRAPEGLIVVDTGRHPEHVREIETFAKSVGQPVKAVVNTHWHLDHIGGNALLRDRFPGLRVYASGALHEARTGFLADYRKQLEAMLAKTTDLTAQESFRAEIRLIDQGTRLEPDEVITGPGKRSIAGLALEVGLETNAVTAGDVWLFSEKSRVLIAGDLVTLPAPLLDTACPARWQASLDRLAGVDFKLLVPGHGRPMTRGAFDTYRTAFAHLLACGRSDRPKEDCISGWLADAGPLVPESERSFARALMDYYVGVLRADPAKIAKLCGQ
jgi:glyoxylase-like metal-dependent hydrolase (beta-lactamase superfamily II)